MLVSSLSHFCFGHIAIASRIHVATVAFSNFPRHADELRSSRTTSTP